MLHEASARTRATWWLWLGLAGLAVGRVARVVSPLGPANVSEKIHEGSHEALLLVFRLREPIIIIFALKHCHRLD